MHTTHCSGSCGDGGGGYGKMKLYTILQPPGPAPPTRQENFTAIAASNHAELSAFQGSRAEVQLQMRQGEY